MRCRSILIALCLCLIGRAAPAAATVRVVATIFPLADVVRQIGREAVDVVTLLPAGASPHTFEPTPAQMREVAQARIAVRVGAGLDAWATKLFDAQSNGAAVVTVTGGLQLLNEAAAHDAGRGDPHVWLDPVLVRDHMVPMLVAALTHADPQRQADFERGAAEFRDTLTRLDAEIRQTLASLPNRSFVTFHAAWRYFARRYDLNEAAVVESFPGKEPSAREIAGVIQAARAAHVRAVLIEPQFSPRVAQQIAREFGGSVLLVDPIGGAGVAGRNTYVDLLRYNVRVFVEALR